MIQPLHDDTCTDTSFDIDTSISNDTVSQSKTSFQQGELLSSTTSTSTLPKPQQHQIWSTMSNRLREWFTPFVLPSSSSSLSSTSSSSSLSSLSKFNFLPDYTEHPKPIIIRHPKSNTVKNTDFVMKNIQPPPPPPPQKEEEDEEGGITFLHDFIAGGVAGSMSVIVGHPFDTVKVRMQTSNNAKSGVLSAFSPEYGGIASLFRGISAPLYTAALVNAIVFGSYGLSSRIYSSYYMEQPTQYIDEDDVDNIITIPMHDPWQKSMLCGSFAGLMQCFVICPMEHVKCRLQVQPRGSQKQGQGGYKSPFSATKSIVTQYGIKRLYQGWWTTCLREVPAFGLYFAVYDYLKDVANIYIATNMEVIPKNPTKVSCNEHSHTWLASAFAGGCAGCITWALVYPVDVIKTRIQTAPLTTPLRELSMFRIGYDLYKQHGVRYLFRGLGVTLIRAFPVNGTIFPVYEFTLKLVCTYVDGKDR